MNNKPIPDDFEDVLDDMDEEERNQLDVGGIYYDGHERPDVVEYRKSFLDEIYSYEKYMVKYEEIILDEYIFYSNDGKRGCMGEIGRIAITQKRKWTFDNG
ncbi:hypothetical protein GLOIN_2v1777976 [Rhizophagus irregularis DAOM 181602=DAOM 197198]|nr:hypothetical protein GLOIN_2v1777976 [Rhizophagus irregularis DAOM 181602=DAOM 197198]